MVAATGAVVLAHANARDKIAGMNTGLHAGSVVRVGSTVELEVLDTPGHTMSHICLLSKTQVPALLVAIPSSMRGWVTAITGVTQMFLPIPYCPRWRRCQTKLCSIQAMIILSIICALPWIGSLIIRPQRNCCSRWSPRIPIRR